MKNILLTFGLVFSFQSFSNAKKFETRKSNAIENITQRLKIYAEAKTCVEKAKKGEDLAKCHKKTQGDMMALRKAFMKQREAFLGIKKKQKPAKTAKKKTQQNKL
jgi:hypothetical protein